MTSVPFSFFLECLALARVPPPSTPVSVDWDAPDPTPSELQARIYFAGLPSNPRLLARTGSIPWQRPGGMEAYRKLKQLGVLVNHTLNEIWETEVAPKVIACLDELKVKWTSLDIVRIGEVKAFPSSDPTLWIGIMPKTLTTEDANTAAFKCLDILTAFDITDVNVELRESVVIRSAGPKLLSPGLFSDALSEVRHPLTHALGLHISAQATPSITGTGGFFMAEGGNSDKLLLITARHVVLPPNETDRYERRDMSQDRYNVLLLGEQAYDSYLTSIKARIGKVGWHVEYHQESIECLKGKGDEMAQLKRETCQHEIKRGEKDVEDLHVFFKDVEKNWATAESRILGHVVCSPPIRLGAGTVGEQYTEDYAIIEVDSDKIDRTMFKGNEIYLQFGANIRFKTQDFESKLYPHPKNATPFKYPRDRHLKLSGTISDDEMRHPTSLDANGEPSLVVIKNGCTTNTTIGHASGIKSFVREYSDDGTHQTSMECAILPYDNKSGAFSAPGDAGAVFVDGQGLIGGLLTSGSGNKDDYDITYATPIDSLLKSIKANGYPNAHLNPT